MKRHALFGRCALAGVTLAVLASCGGGGGEEPQAPAANGTKQALAFVPPGAAAADANVKGMWSVVYDWPLISVHSVILPDGRVMTYGSDLTGLQTGHANYDVWDSSGAPDAGHMTLPNGTGTDIFCSSQLLLPQTGNVFIAGGDVWTGTKTTNSPNNNSNLFDPASTSLTRGINMQRPRWYSSSTTLINGETYIQGGSGGSDRPEIRGVDGTFRLLAGIDTSTINASFPRNFIAPDGRIFGYDPASGQMYYVDTSGSGSISFGARFNTGVSGGWYSSTAMYRPGKILQIGGNSNGAYTIDITGNAPVVTATQSMSSIRAWVNATVLADGKVVATSGSAVAGESGGYNNSAEIWDPTTGQWTVGYAAQKMRLYHSNAILLPDASVLTSGGGAISPLPVSDPNKNNLNAEIYYPPYLFAANGVRATRPVITTGPGYLDIGKTYGVDLTGAASVSRVTLVKTGSVSHSFNFEQRFMDLPFKASSAGHITIQAPTRAADAPPGYYMLFVFNEAGVPSVARIVRVGVATNPNPAITPVVANPGAQTSVAGVAANLALGASDPNADVLSYGAAGLPTGLSINPTNGVISGTATTAGVYNVIITATDGVNTGSASYTWTVRAPVPLTLAAPTTAAFVVANGVASYTATGTGINVRFQWNFGDGTAPTAWSSSGTATHAYAAGGTYAVTVSVTDDSGAVQSRSFTQAVYLPTTAKRPAASASLAVETPASGNPRVWVVNQDNDSVSVFDTVTYSKLGEVTVGSAPRALAIAPNGLVWVTNKQGASITVIDPATRSVVRTIALARGSQPFGIVMSPVAGVAYVALEAGGQVLRFDTASFAQTGSLAVGLNVRHLSITADGANLYASRFITPPLPGEGTATVVPTATTGGEVLQVSTATLANTRTIVLQHSDKTDGENQARGIPNYLAAAVISPDGTQAWVPSKQDNIKRGALRDGTGLNFQDTVRAVTSRINLATNTETLASRIDHDNSSVASGAAYDPRGVYLFVALETSREVAVLNAFSGQQLFRIDAGRAPQAVAVSADGTKLFISNFMDRTVSVRNLVPLLQQGVYDLPPLATLSAVGTESLASNVLAGKQFFYDARDTRLARDRYMSCASCHADGGHDGRVWDMTSLGEGLRNTITLRGRGGRGHGFLHWSNNFDEVQDFEGQIRTLAGGTGLMTDALFNAGTRSQALGATKAGSSSDLDALAAYVGSLATFDPAPARPGATTLSANATAGKAVFATLNCASCHSGLAFTGSGENTLVNIGTIKASSGKRLGGPLGGIDVPTLRDVWATAPYLHDGSAPTLELAVRAHVGVTVSDADLARLTGYLREIGGDEAEAIPTQGTGTGLAASYFANATLSGAPAATRVEAVDFDWGTASPAAGIPVDNFSVRWQGTLTAPSTGTYRFQTYSDDGVRVWVNGVPMIDDWTDHGPTTDTSGALNLVAGQRVAITVEFYERGGGATMRLRWLTPGNVAYVAIPASALTPGTPTGAGTGLVGTYFNNADLGGAAVLTRTEAVDFDWGTGSPGTGVNADNFSVRWSGTVLAASAGNYRFQTYSDDGVRLWVNGVLVVDNWTDHGPVADNTAAIALAAGQRASIRMEYYERGLGATASLRWLPPGTSTYAPVPVSNLYPN